MTIEEKTMTTLRLRWPSTLTAGGLFILSLTAATGNANAQVFFLQGEKGDQGLQGAPGDSIFSCAGNNCSTTKNVSVGGLTSNGVYLGPETTRTVNLSHTMSADQIQTAIDAVGKHVPYGASVTFQFADGTYTLNHPLTFQGFDDGGRILVLGNRAESAGLHTDQAVFLDFSGQDCDGILAYGNSATAEIDFLRIMVKSDSAGTAAVKASWDSFVEMSGDYVTGTSVSTQSFGVYMDYGGMLKVSGTYFSNIHYALTACYGSTVSSDGNGSTGTSPAYSLYAVYGGTIAKNSSQPAGPEIATAGGEIR